jgi:diketogulonate reductase-like aldo/keto reductase
MQLKYIDLLYLHWPVVDIGSGGEFNHKSLEDIWG